MRALPCGLSPGHGPRGRESARGRGVGVPSMSDWYIPRVQQAPHDDGHVCRPNIGCSVEWGGVSGIRVVGRRIGEGVDRGRKGGREGGSEGGREGEREEGR